MDINNIVLVFNHNDKILGFTTSYQEADDICKKYTNYTWEFSNKLYKNKNDINKEIMNLKQLTIHD